ncbi:MAG: hypothetical protein K9K67_12085 [Bacteriovoracaceae bacterium]|nr:hypothetical protein [Bacteriovoracaceae bacterium]
MQKLFYILLLAIKLSYGQVGFPENLEGSTFEYLGPNCFGVAMLASGQIDSIRGIDLKEFEVFIKNSCKEVSTPKRGDIGTFHNGQSYIHAFFNLGNDLVLEKTGVDYMGKTPIHLRDISHTIYTFEASSECRRYGGGSRDCYNRLRYFRCSINNEELPDALKAIEDKIFLTFSEYLNKGLSSLSLPELEELISEYSALIESQSDANMETLLARLESVRKQFQFLTY